MMDGIHLARDRVQWLNIVTAIMNRWYLHTWGNYLICWAVISFSRRNKSNYSGAYPTRCNFTQFILSGHCSTCFGWYLHPSSGAQKTVSVAFGISHAVTLIYRYRGRVGTGLSVLWVAYPQHTQTSSNSSTIAAGSSNGVTNTRCCGYSCLRSWWWVEVPPETCRAVSR